MNFTENTTGKSIAQSQAAISTQYYGITYFSREISVYAVEGIVKMKKEIKQLKGDVCYLNDKIDQQKEKIDKHDEINLHIKKSTFWTVILTGIVWYSVVCILIVWCKYVSSMRPDAMPIYLALGSIMGITLLIIGACCFPMVINDQFELKSEGLAV